LSRCTHKAVQLGYGCLVPRVTDVPHLDAALASGVDVVRRVADGDRAHHVPMVQGVDLARMAGDAGADECVRGERHGLHLSVGTHVEGVGPEGEKGVKCGVKKVWAKSDKRKRRKKKRKTKQDLLTYGFPPGMPDRLGGRPGTRMWW